MGRQGRKGVFKSIKTKRYNYKSEPQGDQELKSQDSMLLEQYKFYIFDPCKSLENTFRLFHKIEFELKMKLQKFENKFRTNINLNERTWNCGEVFKKLAGFNINFNKSFGILRVDELLIKKMLV